jgi:hypothetical protein
MSKCISSFTAVGRDATRRAAPRLPLALRGGGMPPLEMLPVAPLLPLVLALTGGLAPGLSLYPGHCGTTLVGGKLQIPKESCHLLLLPLQQESRTLTWRHAHKQQCQSRSSD